MEIICNWDMTNVTDYHSGPYPCVFLSDCRLAAIFYGIISGVAVILNIVAVTGIFLLQSREPHMLFLLNLTIADLISPVFQIVSVSMDPWCDGTYKRTWLGESTNLSTTVFGLCTYAMQLSANYAVLLTSLCMAVDRLVATTKPFQHKGIVTKKRSMTALGAVWFVALFLGFLGFFLALNVPPETRPKQLDPTYASQMLNDTIIANSTVVADISSDHFDSNNNSKIAASSDDVLLYIGRVHRNVSISVTTLFGIACFVFLVLTVVYSLIFREIRNHQKFASVSSQQKTSIVRGVVTSLLIVGSFAFCWLPYSVSFMVTLYGPASQQAGLISVDEYAQILSWRNASFALVLLNSILDPMIYVSRNVKIRTALWKKVEALAECLRNVDFDSRGTEMTSTGSSASAANDSQKRYNAL